MEVLNTTDIQNEINSLTTMNMIRTELLDALAHPTKEKLMKLSLHIPILNERYYSGNPLITDIEYDKFVEMLRAYKIANTNTENISQENEIGEEIGEKHLEIPEGDKTQLPYIMSGLKKYKKNTIMKWLEKFQENQEFLIEEKLDGMSCYVKLGGIEEKVVSAITRGDGHIGRNITQKLKHIKVKTFTQTTGNVQGGAGEFPAG